MPIIANTILSDGRIELKQAFCRLGIGFCVLSAAPLNGCARQPEVVGTWAGQITLPGNAGISPSSITLRPDGTFHKMGGTEAEYSGTYTIMDHVLTETFKSYTVEGHTMQIPEDMPNVEVDTYNIQGDTLTLAPKTGGPPSILKRQP